MNTASRRARIVWLALPLLAGVLTAQPAPELVLSVGHAGAPSGMVFVGNYLATEESSNVNVIDLASGLTVARLPQGSLVVTAMDGSRDGDLLAVGTCGNAVNVWNVKSRTLVRRFAISNECAQAVAISADGALLASAANGNDARKGIQIWDVRTGSLIRELLTSTIVYHLVFGGDGRWLAAVDETGKATVFEWPSARVLQTIDGLELSGWSGSTLLASRDGRYLCWLAGPNGLRLFEIEMGREISMPGARPVRIVDPSPDGTDHERAEHRIEATAAAFLDDSRVAYLNRFENGDLLHLLRLPGGEQEARQLARPIFDSHGGDVVITYQPSWLAIARNGRLLAGSGGLEDNDSRTVIWDVAKARLRELTAPALDSPEWLQWSQSGLIVWSGLGVGVHGWDDRAGKPVRFGKSRYFADAVGLSSDGTRLAASGLTLSLLDPATGRELASRDRETSTNAAVAITADGSTLAFASAETDFGVFDNRLQLKRRLEPFDDKTRVEHPAFSPDGRWIAAGISGPRSMLRVWSVLDSEAMPVTLDQRRVFYGPQPPAFSTDSRRLASFVRGKSLTIWKTGSWEAERSWALKDRGRALAFAPEGSRLAIAADGEAAIWDADTGGRLVTFSSPGSSEMKQIAWSPDGQRVLTVADDGVLRFWRAADGQLLASLYVFDVGDDWLLVTPDGRLDGSTRALRRLVAWRVGERVGVDGALTRRHRVAGLWRALSP